MERLGFLQLAKRFLLLGKEANTTPTTSPEDSSRFIQRPPAGRTLSLKIFNRVASSDRLDELAEVKTDRLPRAEPKNKAYKKKFHSYKEGAAAARARKENADPRLGVASVGRKHVWGRGGGGEVVAELRRPPPQRTLLYQEYTTRVAQIPGLNIIPDLGRPASRGPAGADPYPRKGRISNNNNNEESKAPGELWLPQSRPSSVENDDALNRLNAMSDQSGNLSSGVANSSRAIKSPSKVEKDITATYFLLKCFCNWKLIFKIYISFDFLRRPGADTQGASIAEATPAKVFRCWSCPRLTAMLLDHPCGVTPSPNRTPPYTPPPPPSTTELSLPCP
jgi:hypothetical protein